MAEHANRERRDGSRARPVQARTRLARQAVVGAARTLFLERGYVATTLEAVSGLADVPPATLYRLFGSKLGILEALLDTSIAGDDEPLALQERPEVASLFDESDPVGLLTGVAGLTTEINQRTHDVYRVLVSASDSDAAAAGLLEEIQERRGRGQSQVVHALRDNGSLREDLRAVDAVDLVHALMSPEVYGLLVVDRKWPPEKYRQWLAATLVQQLV